MTLSDYLSMAVSRANTGLWGFWTALRGPPSFSKVDRFCPPYAFVSTFHKYVIFKRILSITGFCG